MRSWPVGVTLIIVLCAPSAAATSPPPVPVWPELEPPLTNAHVVALKRASFSPDVIICQIESAETAFDTSPSAMSALAEEGVELDVLTAMVKASARSRDDARPTTPDGSGTGVRGSRTRSDTFRDPLASGGEGPEMRTVPAGRFRMGCLSRDDTCWCDELPQCEISIARPFAMSVYELTVADFAPFMSSDDLTQATDTDAARYPVFVSWQGALAYAAWLSSATGARYRLPSEAEWEYAARAGSTTTYGWGDELGCRTANCHDHDCGDGWVYSSPVGSFARNAFGLFDMHGNAHEWVADCYNETLAAGPTDGTAWEDGNCAVRVLRGGAWWHAPEGLRSAARTLELAQAVVGGQGPGIRVSWNNGRALQPLRPEDGMGGIRLVRTLDQETDGPPRPGRATAPVRPKPSSADGGSYWLTNPWLEGVAGTGKPRSARELEDGCQAD